jgi:hypothetical protein
MERANREAGEGSSDRGSGSHHRAVHLVSDTFVGARPCFGYLSLWLNIKSRPDTGGVPLGLCCVQAAPSGAELDTRRIGENMMKSAPAIADRIASLVYVVLVVLCLLYVLEYTGIIGGRPHAVPLERAGDQP